MNLGKILENIVERKVHQYNLNYDSQNLQLFNTIKELPGLSSLKVSPILLVTNKNPDSLISIAYAIKIMTSLGKERRFYVVSEGKHSNLIRVSIEDIQLMVAKYKIGLLIVSYGNPLWKSIIDNAPTSVLVTSLKNFIE